jgi:peptidyl-lysine (3S)-dioxygenase / protease
VHSVDGLQCFVYPAEAQMSMSKFLEMITIKGSDDAVPYLSSQNSNMTEYFPELLDDIDANGLPIGNRAFQGGPEAINIWIGDERSISSLHKDHFENLYVVRLQFISQQLALSHVIFWIQVISGEKVFTLFPPTDIAFFDEQEYPSRRYTLGELSEEGRPLVSSVTISQEDCPSISVPWIAVDPISPGALQENPMLQYASPITVVVRAGQTLYIPAMWYHRVTQTEPTVAVNFWYDMAFDFR